MKNRLKYTALIAALLLGTGMMISQARVSLRWGSASDSTRALEGAGGSLAYESTITLNGGKGDLTIVGFEKKIGSVISSLSTLFNIHESVAPGSTMAFLTAHADGYVLRLIVIQLGHGEQTLVFTIRQTEADYLASTRPPEIHMLKDMPAFPGSDPLFYAVDDKSQAGVELSTTSSDTDAVHTFFAAQLAASGWVSSIPAPATAGTQPAMKVYMRDAEVCCVMVDPSESSAKNRITILHKKRGIE